MGHQAQYGTFTHHPSMGTSLLPSAMPSPGSVPSQPTGEEILAMGRPTDPSVAEFLEAQRIINMGEDRRPRRRCDCEDPDDYICWCVGFCCSDAACFSTQALAFIAIVTALIYFLFNNAFFGMGPSPS